MMIDCVFCRIIATVDDPTRPGAEPARVVAADEDTVAFLDHRPVRPGHTLVVPRLHAVRLADLPPDAGGPMFRMGQRVAAALGAAPVAADGVNLVVNDGRAAMQTVFHVHLHVIPRHHGDRLSLAKSLVTRRDTDADATAAALRARLAPN